MKSLLITPKDQAELDLLSNLLTRLKVSVTVVTEEDKEDVGLGLLLQEADRTQQVSREDIFRALGRV